jgi:transcriptional regulator with XRE-family HTH domain
MYTARLRRNLRPVIEEHGFKLISNTPVLKSISVRHIWNVERGLSKISVNLLEDIADEIGADFLEFFRE